MMVYLKTKTKEAIMMNFAFKHESQIIFIYLMQIYMRVNGGWGERKRKRKEEVMETMQW